MDGTIVIGAGPGGLAVAAELGRRGRPATVLERDSTPGGSFRRAYDRLHLNTARAFSGLPGLPIPREAGRFPSRDDFLAYLDAYVRHHALDVRTGVEVAGLRREDGGWAVETTTGELSAHTVVIATGFSHTPFVPDWPGADAYAGPIVHSSGYRTGGVYAGQGVLVVGAGNSGAEIAVDLAEQGADEVWLSVRTPPHIVLRQSGGVPSQLLGIIGRRLPSWVGDWITKAARRLSIGDLSDDGLPVPEEGLMSAHRREGITPIIDAGLVNAVRSGSVRVVTALERLERDAAVLTDGTRLPAAAVVAATGYRRRLEPLVGDLALLDGRGLPIVHGAGTHRRAPGLHFIGYTDPISGNLRELRLDARRIGRAIANGAPARDTPHWYCSPAAVGG